MTEEKKQKCACSGSATLIFSCSGAADTCEIADRASREIARRGCAVMSYLAGISENISGFIVSARGAERLLVVDGCKMNCALNALKEKGINDNIIHLTVTDLGFVKGKTKLSETVIKTVVCEMQKKLVEF